MSAQVDVLAVMDAIIRAAESDAKTHRSASAGQAAAVLKETRAAVAALIAERDALLVIARDFDEVLREKGLRCECGELDCRTSRLDAALALTTGESA